MHKAAFACSFAFALAGLSPLAPVGPALTQAQAQQAPSDSVMPKIVVDTSKAPDKAEFGEQCKELIEEWYIRSVNILCPEGWTGPDTITLEIRSLEGERLQVPAYCMRGRDIVVNADWLEKRPDDIGCVYHEMIHVIGHYPRRHPAWLREGIADYMRWGIYESKPQSWFKRPKRERGYEMAYQITAGFLLWLERGQAPGIVRQLDQTCRDGSYNENTVKELTGRSIDELWNEYVGIEPKDPETASADVETDEAAEAEAEVEVSQALPEAGCEACQHAAQEELALADQNG